MTSLRQADLLFPPRRQDAKSATTAPDRSRPAGYVTPALTALTYLPILRDEFSDSPMLETNSRVESAWVQLVVAATCENIAASMRAPATPPARPSTVPGKIRGKGGE